MKFRMLACVIVACCLLAGCEKVEENAFSEEASFISVSVEETATETSAETNHGETFNEEVFNQITITIPTEGIEIPFPCTYNDIANYFVFHNSPPYIDADNSIAAYSFSYDGEHNWDGIQFPSNRDLNDSEKETMLCHYVAIGPYFDERNCVIFIAGLTVNDTYQTIIDKFGEPIDGINDIDSEGNGTLRYYVNPDDFQQSIEFQLKNNLIKKITLADFTRNPEILIIPADT